MLRTGSVIRLHARNWSSLLLMPLTIMAITFVVILAIGVIANLVGGNLDNMYEGMRWNGAVWSGIGPIVALGIGAMLQFFPLSLGLGLTRREFLAGTSVVIVGIAGVFTLLITVLKAIEQATTGWGLRVRMFDTVWVGTGPAWQTAVQTFLVLLTGMLVGAALSTVFLRFGQNVLWLVIAAFALVGVLGAGLVIVLEDLASWFWSTMASMTWGSWMLVLGLVVLVFAGAWVLLVRKAPVR